MSTGRWKVSRHQLPWEQCDGEWFAVPSVDNRNEGEYFHTHAEALAHADHRSRTVEVELPEIVRNKCINPDMSPAMFVEKTPTGYGIYLGHRHMVGITPSELKPLGEYLLSLHYLHERNQK